LLDKNPTALEWLSQIGHQQDDEIDLLKGALALGALERPATYDLSAMHDAVITMKKQLAVYSDNSLEDKINALNDVLFAKADISGNYDDYDDLKNANMLDVLERKKGLPVALGILYIILAKSRKWDIEGLSFPGHFIVRLTHEGQRELIDPFNAGRILNASDLRQIIKAVMGQDQELSSSYYDAVSNRELLLRLQNNIKMRYVREENYEKALEQIEIMMLIAPDEEKLLFDAGILHYQLDNFSQAIDMLEQYKKNTKSAKEQQEASVLIYEIQKLLD